MIRAFWIQDYISKQFARVTNGGLDVNIQDQSTRVINLRLSEEIQLFTLAVSGSVDDTTITITSGAEPTNGNLVCLKEGDNFYQGRILSHAANGANWDVALDSPLDFAFTTAGGCSERNDNMAVDGSVTPRVFSISPAGLTAGTQWDVVRILGTMLDATVMDDGTFGGLAALTKGVLFRIRNSHTQNLFNVKSNGEWKLEAFDVSYADKPPAGTNYGFAVRRTYGGQSKAGVVLRLSEATSDSLEMVIQDNLTGLNEFFVCVQGHVTDNPSS